MIRHWLSAALIATLAGCGPNLAGLQSGERGRVTEIVDGDTLVLESGLRVTLTGVEAPYGNAPYAHEARAALERLALGRPAQLAYGGLKRIPPRPPHNDTPGETAANTPESTAAPPRAETALAQVFVQSEGGRWLWLQHALVAEDDVWVRTRKDNVARAADLLAAESHARQARLGLWALPDYRLRTPLSITAETASLPDDCRKRGAPFRIVQGRISDVQETPRRVTLTFGPEPHSPEIVVFGDAVASWRARGPAFETYRGKRVRAHGAVENRYGVHLCADHPEQIEVLAAN